MVVLEGFGDSGACLEGITEHQFSIFYAHPLGNGQFTAEYYDTWAATDPPNAATVLDILEIAGQDAIFPEPDTSAAIIPTLQPQISATPPTITVTQASKNTVPLPLLLTLLAISLISGIAAWLILFRRRQS